MARAKGTLKGITVTLSKDVIKALDEHRWERRMTFSELVDSILRDYCDDNGIELVAVEPVTGPAK